MSEKETKWFLYMQGDAFTNEAVVRELAQASIADESITEVMYHGRRVQVWNVPHTFVRLLQLNKAQFPFRFEILVQEGGGTVRRWNLQNRGILARQKQVRKIARTLAKRTQRSK